jgi:hypothetical protein
MKDDPAPAPMPASDYSQWWITGASSLRGQDDPNDDKDDPNDDKDDPNDNGDDEHDGTDDRKHRHGTRDDGNKGTIHMRSMPGTTDPALATTTTTTTTAL